MRVEESDKPSLIPALKIALRDVERVQGKVMKVGGRRFHIGLSSDQWDEKGEAFVKGIVDMIIQRGNLTVVW